MFIGCLFFTYNEERKLCANISYALLMQDAESNQQYKKIKIIIKNRDNELPDASHPSSAPTPVSSDSPMLDTSATSSSPSLSSSATVPFYTLPTNPLGLVHDKPKAQASLLKQQMEDDEDSDEYSEMMRDVSKDKDKSTKTAASGSSGIKAAPKATSKSSTTASSGAAQKKKRGEARGTKKKMVKSETPQGRVPPPSSGAQPGT